MKKPKLEYRRTEVLVKGRGRFPIDMLRYDNAVPVSGQDVFSIEEDDYTVDRSIKLERFSLDGNKCERDRWLSFGWDVISDTGVE